MKQFQTDKAGWVVGLILFVLFFGVASGVLRPGKPSPSGTASGPFARPYFPAPQRGYDKP